MMTGVTYGGSLAAIGRLGGIGAAVTARLGACVLALLLALSTQAMAFMEVVTEPTSQTANVGDQINFHVEATGVNLYRWQVDRGTGFTTIDSPDFISDGFIGYGSPTLIIPSAKASMNGWQFRVLLSEDSGATFMSLNPVSLTVLPPAPTITGISPTEKVVTADDITATITGTNLSDAQSVVFGIAHATDLHIVNDTTITVTVPPNIPGTYDVTVNTSASHATAPGAFTYKAPASNDAKLSSLSLANLTFSPVFNSDLVTYQASASSALAMTSVTAATSDPHATFTVNGLAATSDVATGPIVLDVGQNTIEIVVTAEDGQAQETYKVVVTRDPIGPAIALHPASQSVTPKSAVTFYVSASGITSRKWQVRTTPSSDWTDLQNDLVFRGATTTNLMVIAPPITMDGYQLRFVGADDEGNLAISDPATMTVMPSTSPVELFPEATALPEGEVGKFYSFTFTASGGVAPYKFVMGGDHAPGMSLDPDTGVYSGTPVVSYPFKPTINVTDADGNFAVAGYLFPVAPEGGVKSSDATLASLQLSAGTLEPGFTPEGTSYVATVPYDVAEISVTAVTANPGATFSVRDTPGVSGEPVGPFSLSVGSNKVGIYVLAEDRSTQVVYALSVVRQDASPVSLSPASGALAAGTVGASYSQTLSASGGTAPYTYAVTDGELPAGLTLLEATGVIAGTPSHAGDSSFTVKVTDANAVTGSAVYTLSVDAPPPGKLVFSPAAGALPDAMAGEDYTQAITVTGGREPIAFSVASGQLPDGLSLTSSGALAGTLGEKSENAYAFLVHAEDADGLTATVAYTLDVKAREVTVQSKTVPVAPGTMPADVRLDAGATGGPFTLGELVSVEPAQAGQAQITRGDYAQAGAPAPSGWYLKFVPNPAYSGNAHVRFRLTSALGVSNTGTVTYSLGFDPAAVAREMDGLVRGFVQTRQSLIATTAKRPGLLERRRMRQSGSAVSASASPDANGLTVGYSTSLAQIEAARNGGSDADASPVNVWLDGTFMFHQRQENGGRWGSFGMVSLGADYLLSERALVGFAFHYDRMTDPTNADAKLTGNGWLAGPYASFEVGTGVFWDTSLLYGGSANTIDTAFWDGKFDTTRWLFDTSISGQWMLDQTTVLTPKLRAVYLSERVKDYTVDNGLGAQLGIGGFTAEQLRVNLGAEIARSFTLQDGSKLSASVGAAAGFAGLDGTGAFGTLSVGMKLDMTTDWTVDTGLLFNIEQKGSTSMGAKLGIRKQF